MSDTLKYFSRLKIFFLIFFFSIGLILILLLTDKYIYTYQTKKELLNNSLSVSLEDKNYIDKYFSDKSKLLLSIEQSQAFYDYMNDITIYQDNLKDLFLAIARNQNDIMQVRFIDKSGMEKIRVDRTSPNKKPKLISNKKLQNKADRYYFTNPKNKKNDVWFSDLDLNIENGKVQTPFVPTIRAIQPVYDGLEFKGIIIINFFAQEVVSYLTNSDLYQIVVIDSKRNIIKHFDSQYDWNYYTKKDYIFDSETQNYLNKLLMKDYIINDEYSMRRLKMPVENDFTVIYRINQNYLDSLESQKFDIYLTVIFIMVLVILIFSIIISNIFNKLLKDIYKSREKAINASKAKSEFLANMSHEIRTPLNGIIGLIQLTLDTKLDKRQEDFLFKAKSSSNALLTVINDILDYSKIEAGKLTLKKQEFILQNLLDNVSDLFGFKIHEKGLKLEFVIDHDVPNILVSDSLRITQILNNLVGNAVKFTHEGKIVIHIRLVEKIEKTNNIILQFCIEDSGIGISQDDLKNLFNAFIQAEDTNTKKYGGTGLGLTITRQLAQLLGGEVWAESIKGVGSKFYFTVQCEYRNNLNSIEIKKFMTNKKFLIVDDDSSQRLYLETVLASWHTSFKSVQDGFKAIELLEKESFDYVLLDWNMPIMNGVEVIKALNEKNIKLPLIIMVTAFEKNDLQNDIDSNELKVDKVLSKPFTPSILFEIITNEQRKISKTKKSTDEIAFEGKVLLVEDNEVNQLVATKFLEKFALDVVVANDGLEAVERVKESEFDIIFMDLQMPNMDGFEATKIIRKMGNKTPIIALSAAVMQKDRELTNEVGMNKHIAKPIIIDELREILFEYLKEKQTQVIQDIVIENQTQDKEDDECKIYGLDVEAFLESTGLDEETLVEMLNSYYKSNKLTIDQLKSMSTNSEEFSQLIHKLKGSSGNFQLKKIYSLCAKIEEVSESERVDLLDDLYVELELTLESIHAFLKLENSSKKVEDTSDILKQTDDLILKTSEFSFISTNEIDDLLINIPDGLDFDLNEIKDNFNNKDYEKLENSLKKLRGLIDVK